MEKKKVFFIVFSGLLAMAFMKENYTPVYILLNEARPLEEEAEKALHEGQFPQALKKYRAAVLAYEKVKEGFSKMPTDDEVIEVDSVEEEVDLALRRCRKVIEEIRERAEKEDACLKSLYIKMALDFQEEDFREITKLLTELTGLNIFVDKHIFQDSGGSFSPRVSLRVNEGTSLREALVKLTRAKGLDFVVEDDHVFISLPERLYGQPSHAIMKGDES